MEVIKGDLLNYSQLGYFDVIIHGCNCFCTFGAGLAKQMKTLYPESFKEDLKTVKGDIKKLGTISYTKIPYIQNSKHIDERFRVLSPNFYLLNFGLSSKNLKTEQDYLEAFNDKYLHIINAYIQYNFGTYCIQVIYEAVRNCFKKIKEVFGNKNLSFGIPKIGAGLAGGNWDLISSIIAQEMRQEKIIVVEFLK